MGLIGKIQFMSYRGRTTFDYGIHVCIYICDIFLFLHARIGRLNGLCTYV